MFVIGNHIPRENISPKQIFSNKVTEEPASLLRNCTREGGGGVTSDSKGEGWGLKTLS